MTKFTRFLPPILIVACILAGTVFIAYGAATDSFQTYRTGLDSPADSAATITTSDTNDLSYVTRAVIVGTTGSLKVDMKDGSTVTYNTITAGQVYPFRVKKIYNSSTAGNINAIW